MSVGVCQKIGFIAGWNVFVTSNRVRVIKEGDRTGATMQVREIPNYGTDVCELLGRPGGAIGWGRMPDDEEIPYFYDKRDGCFGYALNVNDPQSSEWGYSPFCSGDDDDALKARYGGPRT